MINDPETARTLARQRQRELVEEADRERQARHARERSRDTKRRDR